MKDPGLADTPILTVVSRRGGGVWSTLPGLTLCMTSALALRRPVAWFDFGRRYEMLNHLGIGRSEVPLQSSLIELVDAAPTEANMMRLTDLALKPNLSTISPLGEDDAPAYCRTGTALLGATEVLMIPAQAAHDVAPDVFGEIVTPERYASATSTVCQWVRPSIVMLTFEGQPEKDLFRTRLQQDRLLRWALDNSDLILSPVRRDSPERFDDGVAIPTLISREQRWSDKVRILMTRSEPLELAGGPLESLVVGDLPFGAFIGDAISRGRIPLLEARLRADREPSRPDEVAYLDRMRAVALRLGTELGLPPPPAAPEEPLP
jgi:hypothetical protein